MKIGFKHGHIKVAEGAEPNWDEVAARLRFAQHLGDANVCFLRAERTEEGAWVVPFFSAENSTYPGAVDMVLQKWTPYEVLDVDRVDVQTVPVDDLSVLLQLAEAGAPEASATDLGAVDQEPAPAAPADPERVFDGLVGMDRQKETLIKLSKTVAKHGRSAVDCFHFVFVGRPGTGKSELASRLVTYLDGLGVTDGTHKFVKVSGNGLVADYVGQTGNKVRKIIDSAVGGMLFIDEFYGLSVSHAGGYGQEALDVLTDRLDALRDQLVCVVAGYPKEVDRTLDLNPGLRDRFGYRIEFPDFTTEELCSIFHLIAERRGFSVSCDEDEMRRALERLKRSKDFSNARSVRRLVDHAVVEASCDHDEATITSKDLLAALPQCVTEGRARMGF